MLVQWKLPLGQAAVPVGKGGKEGLWSGFRIRQVTPTTCTQECEKCEMPGKERKDHCTLGP